MKLTFLTRNCLLRTSDKDVREEADTCAVMGDGGMMRSRMSFLSPCDRSSKGRPDDRSSSNSSFHLLLESAITDQHTSSSFLVVLARQMPR